MRVCGERVETVCKREIPCTRESARERERESARERESERERARAPARGRARQSERERERERERASERERERGRSTARPTTPEVATAMRNTAKASQLHPCHNRRSGTTSVSMLTIDACATTSLHS